MMMMMMMTYDFHVSNTGSADTVGQHNKCRS